MAFQTIGFIGLGLIGGSIAKKMKSNQPDIKIYATERLFDFASALAGDDVEKMKKMQTAMQKGFKQATGAWGKDLPDICQKTLDAANQKFEDYYKSKESTTKTEG